MSRKIIFGSLLFLSSFLAATEDPFRWLEEGDSGETQAWLEGQRAAFEQVIDGSPFRERLEELTRGATTQQFPLERGGHLFYVSGDAIWRDGERLLDGKGITGMRVSQDGSMLAYGSSERGTDQQVWRLYDLEQGRHLDEEIEGIHFYQPDLSFEGHALYYWRLEGSNYGLYAHRVGTPQTEDQQLLTASSAAWLEDLEVVGSGQLYLEMGDGIYGGVYLYDLETGHLEKLLEAGEGQFIGMLDGAYLFQKRAGFGSVIAIRGGTQEVVIPEGPLVLETAQVVGDRVALVYMDRAIQRLFISDLMSSIEVELPGAGTISSMMGGCALSGSPQSSLLMFHYTDLITPRTLYRCDVRDGEIAPLFGEVPGWDRLAMYQAEVLSEDGTPILATVFHDRELDLSQPHPTLLYGYGGFGLSVTPIHSPMQQVWLENGGIYVIAHIRGGGEYGQVGREVGCQKSIQDLIAVADWLVEGGIAEQLALYGRSKGGFLAANAALQRPDLFAAAIVSVGVHDLIRFPLFGCGESWITEFGDPGNPVDRKQLLAMSPYHLAGGIHPPVLVTTGLCDDRVAPLHSFKLAAALQERGEGQTLLRVDPEGTHGPSTAEHADMLAFLDQAFKMS